MKSIAYAIVASTALVMACIAPSKSDQNSAAVLTGLCVGVLLARKD